MKRLPEFPKRAVSPESARRERVIRWFAERYPVEFRQVSREIVRAEFAAERARRKAAS